MGYSRSGSADATGAGQGIPVRPAWDHTCAAVIRHPVTVGHISGTLEVTAVLSQAHCRWPTEMYADFDVRGPGRGWPGQPTALRAQTRTAWQDRRIVAWEGDSEVIHQCDMNTFRGPSLAAVFKDATAWVVEHGSDMTVLALTLDYDHEKGAEVVYLKVFHEMLGETGLGRE